MECKAFNQALKEMTLRPDKVKKWLEDKRMTTLEKKILEGHMLIRDNKNHQLIDSMTLLTDSHIEYINAHKNLLLGIAYNNLSKYREANSYFENAATQFLTLKVGYYYFATCFNQFMLYANVSDLPQMLRVLTIMRGLTPDARLSEIRLMRCEFIYADEANNIPEAEKWIKVINRIKPELIESDLIAHLVAEFIFFTRNDRFDKSRVVLNQMKLHRKFNLSENYNFMKIMLDHLTLNAPIYAYDTDFKNIPVLFYQLKVIQALEANDLSEAQKFWDILQKEFPAIYLENFKYVGHKCLFSHGLDKHQASKAVHAKPVDDQLGSKAKTLLSMIQASEKPLSKSYAYEMLWGEPPSSKEDMTRLTRLVSKIRAKYGFEIQTRKGNYFLEKKAKRKKVA